MKVLVDKDFLEEGLELICDKIRVKTGGTGVLAFPVEMAAAVESIAGSGGITPTGTKEITENGTVDVSAFAEAHVAVVPTAVMEIDENGTYDVTEYGSAEVAVPQIPALMDGGMTSTDGCAVTQSPDGRMLAVSDSSFDGENVVGCFIRLAEAGKAEDRINAMFIFPTEHWRSLGEYRAYIFYPYTGGYINTLPQVPRSGNVAFTVGAHFLSVALSSGAGAEFYTGRDYEIYPIRGGGR